MSSDECGPRIRQKENVVGVVFGLIGGILSYEYGVILLFPTYINVPWIPDGLGAVVTFTIVFLFMRVMAVMLSD